MTKYFMRYSSKGKIEFQGQDISSTFERNSFSALSQITVQVLFDQGIINVYNDGILQVSFGPMEEIKSLDGLLRISIESEDAHLMNLSPFFPQIMPQSPELLKRDPKKIGMSIFLQSSPHFYQKMLSTPLEGGLIPS